MKKFLSVLLASVLLISALIVPASAASSVTITRNTTLTKKFNIYQDLTLAPGVTLTTKMAGSEPQGIEILGKLTLGEGARIVGSGIIIMRPGSSYSGITFYYPCGGEYRVFPDMATAYEMYHSADDYAFSFSYSKAAQGWVWMDPPKNGDPFEIVAAVKEPEPLDYALALQGLGLLKGVGTNPDGTTDFALGSELNRAQAVTMMVRLLGKEQEALSGDWSHPFTDVPAWADPYVGYAFTRGITNGVSDTEFGSYGTASAAMYITFILRAMGYADINTDHPEFGWQDAPYFARGVGINIIDEQLADFKRTEAVLASFQALSARCKDGRPLYERLIEQNVFTREQYEAIAVPLQKEP